MQGGGINQIPSLLGNSRLIEKRLGFLFKFGSS